MSNITRFQFEQMQARLSRPATAPPSPPLEKELHRQIMDYCDAQWPRWKYIHSRMDRPTANEAGVPDFVIALIGGRVLYLEVKRPGQKLSPVQRDWHAEMHKLGITVYVVHDMKEFLSILSDLGQSMSNPPPTSL
jgi:hypothetical protein